MQIHRDFVTEPTVPFNLMKIRRYTACLVILTLLGIGTKTQAQETLRESMTGEAAVEGVKGGNNGDTNLQLGPVKLRVSASLDTSFNDNINVAKTGRLDDFIVTPHGDVTGSWQISDLNALTFDLGVGYEFYTIHSGNSSVFLSPNSQIQANIFTGDFKINLHDDFSYQQDPIGVGQLSNVSQFSRFLNDAGIEADWDLNDVILSAAYDHTSFWVFESAFNYLDYQEDTLLPKATFKISKTVDIGLAADFGDSRYDKNIQNNYTFVSVGPLVSAQLSDNLAVNAQAGYYMADFEHGGLNGDTENDSTYYASAGLTHRLSNIFSESATVGREAIPGITSNFTERIYANYSIGWQATEHLNLGSNIWWENLTDSQALARETANRYGIGLSLKYNITEHTSLDAGYQFVIKDADPSSLSYYQDLFSLGVRYQF